MEQVLNICQKTNAMITGDLNKLEHDLCLSNLVQKGKLILYRYITL